MRRLTSKSLVSVLCLVVLVVGSLMIGSVVMPESVSAAGLHPILNWDDQACGYSTGLDDSCGEANHTSGSDFQARAYTMDCFIFCAEDIVKQVNYTLPQTCSFTSIRVWAQAGPGAIGASITVYFDSFTMRKIGKYFGQGAPEDEDYTYPNGGC